MILCDVNVLVYAHREGSAQHPEYRSWLTGQLTADEPFGVSDLVLSGFLRVVTHLRIFDPPSGWGVARDFVKTVRAADNAVPASPGQRHWKIFERLVDETGAVGNALPDDCFAALAIESGAEWITTDRAYARYPGLRRRHRSRADSQQRGRRVVLASGRRTKRSGPSFRLDPDVRWPARVESSRVRGPRSRRCASRAR